MYELLGGNNCARISVFASIHPQMYVCTYVCIHRYSPIGIIFLVASKFVDTDDIADVAARLGMYMVTVLAGLAIHSIVVLPLLYFIVTRKNPGRFFTNMLKALCTAWGTASR